MGFPGLRMAYTNVNLITKPLSMELSAPDINGPIETILNSGFIMRMIPIEWISIIPYA